MRMQTVAKSDGSGRRGRFYAPQHTLSNRFLAVDCTQESFCCRDYYWLKFPLSSFPSASVVAQLHRLIIEAKL